MPAYPRLVPVAWFVSLSILSATPAALAQDPGDTDDTPAPSSAASTGDTPATSAASTDEGLESEEAELRERLTERPDRRRPIDPFTIRLGGHPLTLGGEIEAAMIGVRRYAQDDEEGREDRLLFESGAEIEAFYTLGPKFSAFAQLRFAVEEDLLSETQDPLSEAFVERGEMWIYSEAIGGTPFSIDVGRLDFDEERTFWWDEELDSARVLFELDSFDISLALARELGPARTGSSRVDPDLEGVVRVLSELGWEWHDNHAVEAFLLHQDDHSSTEKIGQTTRRNRIDELDGRLTWLGARLIGAHQFGGKSILGYWLDAGYVWGETSALEFEPISSRTLQAVSRTDRDVSGYAVDVGAAWILPSRFEPRIFAGLAWGSRDDDRGSGTDRAFRQTGLHSNESGFGGVERFSNYGVLLEPELSNLWIWTAGVGFSLFESSSLDLVYHAYRQVHAAPFLRDSLLDIQPDGSSRDIGHGFDVVLAIEEWEQLEFLLIGTAFRAGSAFGSDSGRFSLGVGASVRFAF